MKGALFLIILLLSGIAYNQWDQFSDRHDRTAYYVAHNSPFPLEDLLDNKGVPHTQPYKPGDKLTYVVDRTLALPFTVLATTTRRIVRHFTYENGRRGSEPIYSYPPQPGVEILPGNRISFSHVELPSAKDPPSPMNPNPKDIAPGEYSLETAVSFLYHGEQRTYPAETAPFRVEPR